MRKRLNQQTSKSRDCELIPNKQRPKLPLATSKVETAENLGLKFKHYCGPLIEGPVLTSSIFHFGINQQTPVNGYYGLELGEGLLNTVELQTELRARDSGSRWNHLPALS